MPWGKPQPSYSVYTRPYLQGFQLFASGHPLHPWKSRASKVS